MTSEELQYLLGMMRQYMSTGQGVDPFAPEVGMESSAMFDMLPPSLDKKGNVEPVDLEQRSKQYNIMQDWADMSSDPAILGGLYGSGPGSFDRRALEPTRSYEYLPGQQMLERVLGSSDQSSLEYMIADEIRNGGTPSSAVKYIQTIMEGDDEETKAALSASLPMAESNDYGSGILGDLAGDKKPDYGRVWDIANSYQEALLTDPVANGFDEEGRPAVVTEEESEMARWFRETGTPLPDEQYPVESLMSEGQIRRRDKDRNSALAEQDKMGQVDADFYRSAQQMQARERGPYGILAPEAGAQGVRRADRGGPRGPGYNPDDFPAGGFSGGALNPNNLPVGDTPPRSPDMSFPNAINPNNLPLNEDGSISLNVAPPNPQSAGVQQAIQRGMERRAQPQGPSLMDAVTSGRGEFEGQRRERNRQIEAGRGLRDARGQEFVDNQVRKLVLRQMAQAGHTPYLDTMAGRRMMAQYGGFG